MCEHIVTAFSAPLIIYVSCFYCSWGNSRLVLGLTGTTQLMADCNWPAVRKWHKHVT